MKKIVLPLLMLLALCCASFAHADTWTATAPGRNGDVAVTVDYVDGQIVSVEVGEHAETAGIADGAIAQIPARIVEAQSLNVDVVAGATITSNAILKATENALIDNGVDVTAFQQANEVEITEGQAQETDVVIVGAGIAGLMAAYELQENYPEVSFVVVEKLDMATGSIPPSGGMIVSIGSELHTRDGVVCEPQDIADLMRYTSDAEVDEALINNVYAKSDVLLNRLLAWGFPTNGKTEQSSSYSQKVYALRTNDRGAGFAAFLNQLIKDKPFDLRFTTKAELLIVEDGGVQGVVVCDKTTRYEIRAKAVILATGGFGSNDAMMREYLPRFADGVLSTNAGATGDGFALTEQFQTKVVGAGSMGTIVQADGSALITSNFIVNQNGERFIGETQPKYVIQRAVSQQEGGTAYLLVDDTYADRDTLNAKLSAGFVTAYDSIEALAQGTGINAENLAATVEQYNSLCTAGEDIPAQEFALPASKATSLVQPPFYVEQATLRTFGTIPGIDIDAYCRVLSGDGEVVSGLYAVGELTAGNVFTRQYPGGGIGISYAANSGRYAAEVVAESIMGE